MRLLWRSRGRLRVEEFARGVDDTVAPDPDEGGTSRLIAIARALRSVPLRPTPELTLAVRRRIVNAARAAEVEQPRPLLTSLLEGFRVQRGLAATTALLTAAVALMSIGFGTTKALPGDTLYGLKLGGERIGIALAHSDEARGHSYLQFAEARLNDVSGLIDHDGAWRTAAQPVVANGKKQPERRLAGLVNSTLTTMNGYTNRGATALRRAYQRTGDTAPLTYLDDFTRTQRESLSGMLGKLPAASQSVAGQSLNLVDELGKEANKLLTERCDPVLSCQSEPDQTSPSDPAASTPTQAPTTSLTNNVQTNESDEPRQEPATTPQRTPSTTQQPGTTGTPPSTSTPTGDQPSSSSTPPSTDSTSGDSPGGSGGDSTKDTPSGTRASGSDSTQPSPPAPTGVPSSPASRSEGPDNSGDSGTSTDSTDSPAAKPGDTSADQSSPEATPAG